MALRAVPAPASTTLQDDIEAHVMRYREWVSARQRAASGEPPYAGDAALLREVDPMEMRDAAWECRHGKLPHDRVQTCDCWLKRARALELAA